MDDKRYNDGTDLVLLISWHNESANTNTDLYWYSVKRYKIYFIIPFEDYY